MLDLHGYTIHNAWKRFNDHMQDCYLNRYKYTRIITGHGDIANEINDWCNANHYVRSCERQSPNTGVYKILIKKRLTQN